jgi:hypothetical protein
MDPMTMAAVAQAAQAKMKAMFGQHKMETPSSSPLPLPAGIQPVQAQQPSVGKQIGQGALNGAIGGMMGGGSPFMGALMGAAGPAIGGGMEWMKKRQAVNDIKGQASTQPLGGGGGSPGFFEQMLAQQMAGGKLGGF